MSNQIDDWRTETQTRLKQNPIFQALREKCAADVSGDKVLALVDDAAFYAFQRSKLVLRHMGEFTLHDGDHLFRVLTLMSRLMTAETINELTVPELMLLVLSAFFHDLGMAPSEREVRAWLKNWDAEEPTELERKHWAQFDRFGRARPQTQSQIAFYHTGGEHAKADLLLRYLISEYIRDTNTERARTIIADEWSDKILYRDTNLATELAAICLSHNQDPIDLLELETSLPCGPRTFACLPFVAVCLRLADILNFDAKRTPNVLFSHLGVRHPVSLKEWQKHRAVSAWTISPNVILFAAKCSHPAIEHSIRKFIDLIDRELMGSEMVISRLRDSIRVPFPTHYRLELPAKVDRSKIGPRLNPKGEPIYEFRDCSFVLNQGQIVDLVMGTKLYNNTEVALRELVQNAIDACEVRQAMAQQWGTPYTPEISIQFEERNGTEFLRVTDNGVGMDQQIIEDYFCSIGDSYYKSAEFYELQTSLGFNVPLTSRFGIGVLSCFMVADSITVDTRRLLGPHDSSPPVQVLIEGARSIFWIRKGMRQIPGTAIELSLLDGNPWSALSTQERIQKVKSAVPNPPFQIDVESGTAHESVMPGHFVKTRTKWHPKYRSGRRMDIKFKKELGIAGRATVALLDERGQPTARKTQHIKKIRIVGQAIPITLSRFIQCRVNEITRWSDTITIAGSQVALDEEKLFEDVAKSRAVLAVRGISVPMNLFKEPWEFEGGDCVLKFPFPMELIVDITGSREVDLNSARTRILYNEKWTDFVITVAYLVGRGIRQQVDDGYWDKLQEVWRDVASRYGDDDAGVSYTGDDLFFVGIDRVNEEYS